MSSATSILALDRFTRAALEKLANTPLSSEIQLVERGGEIRLYSSDDADAGRPVIKHIVTAVDIECAGELIAVE